MRLKLDARARRLLRRLPRVNLYSVAELALMAALAVQCARLVWAVLTPVGPLGEWRPAGVQLSEAPGAILSGFDPFFRLQSQAAPTTVTALQITLFGIRMDEASGRGSAIVAGPDGVQRSVSVGEEVQPGVTLKAVAFDHVTLTRGDAGSAGEDLFLDQSGAAPPPAGGPGQPAGSPGGGAGGGGGGGGIRIGQLRSDIAYIPRIDAGRISGLVVRPQGSGEAFRVAGLHDGDVVTSIGGRPVSGPGDLDRLGSEYAGGGNIPLTVERGANTLPLAITIVPGK